MSKFHIRTKSRKGGEISSQLKREMASRLETCDVTKVTLNVTTIACFSSHKAEAVEKWG